MAELNPTIKDALIKIDFVKRYEELSERFDVGRRPSDDRHRLEYLDGGEVKEIIRNAGYIPLFDSREKFFKIKEEQTGRFTFGVHIILRYGLAELVWVVRENGELLLGAPWTVYPRRMIDVNYRIKDPAFSTYEELEEILKISFQMYEDFKKAVISGS